MFFNLISIVFVNGFNIAGPEAQQKSYKESRLLKAHLNSANAEAEKYTDSNKRWSRVDKKKTNAEAEEFNFNFKNIKILSMNSLR